LHRLISNLVDTLKVFENNVQLHQKLCSPMKALPFRFCYCLGCWNVCTETTYAFKWRHDLSWWDASSGPPRLLAKSCATNHLLVRSWVGWRCTDVIYRLLNSSVDHQRTIHRFVFSPTLLNDRAVHHCHTVKQTHIMVALQAKRWHSSAICRLVANIIKKWFVGVLEHTNHFCQDPSKSEGAQLSLAVNTDLLLVSALVEDRWNSPLRHVQFSLHFKTHVSWLNIDWCHRW